MLRRQPCCEGVSETVEGEVLNIRIFGGFFEGSLQLACVIPVARAVKENITEAITVYNHCRKVFRSAFGVGPSPRTEEIFNKLKEKT